MPFSLDLSIEELAQAGLPLLLFLLAAYALHRGFEVSVKVPPARRK